MAPESILQKVHERLHRFTRWFRWVDPSASQNLAKARSIVSGPGQSPSMEWTQPFAINGNGNGEQPYPWRTITMGTLTTGARSSSRRSGWMRGNKNVIKTRTRHIQHPSGHWATTPKVYWIFGSCLSLRKKHGCHAYSIQVQFLNSHSIEAPELAQVSVFRWNTLELWLRRRHRLNRGVPKTLYFLELPTVLLRP